MSLKITLQIFLYFTIYCSAVYYLYLGWWIWWHYKQRLHVTKFALVLKLLIIRVFTNWTKLAIFTLIRRAGETCIIWCFTQFVGLPIIVKDNIIILKYYNRIKIRKLWHFTRSNMQMKTRTWYIKVTKALICWISLNWLDRH